MSKRNGYEVTLSDPEHTDSVADTLEQAGLVITNVDETTVNAEDAIRAGEVHENGPTRYIYSDEAFDRLEPYMDAIEQVIYEFSDDTAVTRVIKTYTVENGELVKTDEEETVPSRVRTRT